MVNLCLFELFLALSDNLAHVKDQAAENILSSLEPAQVKDILRKVADEVLGNLQVVIVDKLFCKTTLRLEQ